MRFTNLAMRTVLRAPLTTVLVSVTVLCCSANVSNGSVLFSDNFDSNPFQSSMASGTVDLSKTGTFTVTSGNIDMVGPGGYGNLCVPAESGSCVDMDGATNGQITSTPISLASGNYTLAFDINGSQRGTEASTTVTFGSFFNQTYNTLSGDTNVVSFNFAVLSPTSAQIVFSSNDPSGDEFGTLVDNVSVTEATGAPEPNSGLVFLGVLPLAWFLRKRLI